MRRWGVKSTGPLMVMLWLVGFIMAGCDLIKIERVEPASSPTGIIFVTATPQAQLVLSEGQRFRPNAQPEPTLEPNLEFFAEANELGRILILEYHRIGYPEQRFQRTPEGFRTDLERLYLGGYYPVNFIDLLSGLPNLPAGKKPVVLTFDDSHISQFHVLDDNTIDADSALGIMMNFHNQHATDWPAKATFFVLGNDTNDYQTIFGQSHWAKAKAQFLVDLGMELGSHTVNHVDLSVATSERIEWELAVSKRVIEDLVPGYTVQTLSVPYGGFPFTLEFLRAGNWGDLTYNYRGNVAAWGGPTVSPFDPAFEPYRVSRLEVTETAIDYWRAYFEQNPDEYYVSDGDPNRITYPEVETATLGP